ncbi:MAG: hypothetical protein ACM3QS_01095 [Bacteroidota bacterium]
MRGRDHINAPWFMFLVLALASHACAPQRSVAPMTAAPTQIQEPSPEPPIPTVAATKTPLRAPTATLTAAPTPAYVTIRAVKGNLFIRRGPDFSYNPVSVLMSGQGAQALARDILARWVQIPLPGDAQKTGWISVQSHYTVVQGKVADLPAVEPTDWPILAYLRNCTYHQMQVDPGEILLPSLDYFPDNELQLDPGTYTVRDSDVAGHPIVLTVQIMEGSQVDIRVDGSGERRKCPAG